MYNLGRQLKNNGLFSTRGGLSEAKASSAYVFNGISITLK